MTFTIKPAGIADAETVALLVGELLNEIMDAMGRKEFAFNQADACQRAENFLRRKVCFAFIARSLTGNDALGLIVVYASHALYAEGDFGTISEFYVRPTFRSQGIGQALLESARHFGRAEAWKRIEVTTPPLPLFQRTLEFYEKQGFAVTGGLKLKSLL